MFAITKWDIWTIEAWMLKRTIVKMGPIHRGRFTQSISMINLNQAKIFWSAGKFTSYWTSVFRFNKYSQSQSLQLLVFFFQDEICPVNMIYCLLLPFLTFSYIKLHWEISICILIHMLACREEFMAVYTKIWILMIR